MFHIVYSRHYWDTEDQGQFTSTWTIYRNIPYSQLSEMQKAIPSLKKNADEFNAEYNAKNHPNVDVSNFAHSEVYVWTIPIISKLTKMSIQTLINYRQD